MKLKRLQNILITKEYTFIYKYYSGIEEGIEELAINDKTDNIILHCNKNTDMLIILTFIDGVGATKNFCKFTEGIYKQIREFFINQKEIKDFKKVINKL